MDEWLNTFSDINPQSEEDAAVEKTKPKLDLFNQVFPAIDGGDKYFFRNLTPEEQDSIEPWMLMRWISAPSKDSDMPLAVLYLNDLVNNNFSIMSPAKRAGNAGHKELQWMLLTMCGSKKRIIRKFLKPPRKAAKNKLEQFIIDMYPSFRTSEIDLFLRINTLDEIRSLMVDRGMTDKEIAEVLGK